MGTKTELIDISAVGVELNEEYLLGISGGGWDTEILQTGCYVESGCHYDDISI